MTTLGACGTAEDSRRPSGKPHCDDMLLDEIVEVRLDRAVNLFLRFGVELLWGTTGHLR